MYVRHFVISSIFEQGDEWVSVPLLENKNYTNQVHKTM